MKLGLENVHRTIHTRGVAFANPRNVLFLNGVILSQEAVGCGCPCKKVYAHAVINHPPQANTLRNSIVRATVRAIEYRAEALS
jgi:hypothetical protein